MRYRAAFFLLLTAFLAAFAWGVSRPATGQESGPPHVSAPRPYWSPGSRHKVQVSDPAVARTIVGRGGRVIAHYGASVLLEASANAIGDAAVRPRDEENVILLNAGPIDTTTPAAQAVRRAGAGTANGLYLVHFAGPIRPEWRQALAATGVEIVTYVPYNTYLVFGAPAAVARAQRLANTSPAIQWFGQYQDVHKIDPSLTRAVATARGAGVPGPVGLVAIQLVNVPAVNAATLGLIGNLLSGPAKNDWSLHQYRNLIVPVAAASIAKIAAQPDVISIQPYSLPQKLDERQDQIVAGNLTGSVPNPGDYLAYLAAHGFTQAQFDTSGFVVNVSDSGIDNGTTTPNHFGLYVGGVRPGTSRIVYNRLEGTANNPSTLAGCDGHGNLNAHIIGGFVPTSLIAGGLPHADSSGFRFGLGVCPFVKMGSSVIFDPDLSTAPNPIDMEARAYSDGSRISSNSWGGAVPPFGDYNIISQAYDQIVRDAQPTGAAVATPGNQEDVVVFAAGNQGPGPTTVSFPGTAKNVIAVGAAENVHPFGGTDGSGVDDTGANSANDIISFSSRGPTTDGRAKPDVMAPGTHVSGGVAQDTNPGATGTALPCYNGSGVSGGPGSIFFPPGQQFYTASSGTSHSCPAVAGACALIRQHFINLGLAPPSPALTKAMLINTARYMTGVSANDNLWSPQQGMGEIDLNNYFGLFDNQHVLRDQVAGDTFTASGQTFTFSGAIVDPSKPLRVTLAWSDPPGSTTGGAWVNNLDLQVSAGGSSYSGNVFSGALSATGGAPDTRNNVESVFLPAGANGLFTVTITATNIAGDGVPNTGSATDQDFALVIDNGTNAPVLQLTFPNGGETLPVGRPVPITWQSSNFPAGHTVKIELSADGGATFPTVIADAAPDVPGANSFVWTPTQPVGNQYRIRITSNAIPAVSDTSDGSFQLVVGGIEVVSPNGGEKWHVGQSRDIVWRPTDFALNSPTAKIELSRDGGANWTVLTNAAPNAPNGSGLATFTWTVTGPATAAARVRVTASTLTAFSDTSDGTFEILDPITITGITPTTGSVLARGTTVQIHWTMTGYTGNVRIELSRNAGRTWETILSSVPATSGINTVNWTVTGPATRLGRIRITTLDESPSFSAVSNGVFEIAVPSLNITSPTSNQTLLIGTTATIKWSRSGFPAGSTVRLEVSRNGGSSWQLITSSTENDGVFDWLVTGPVSSQAQLRVTSIPVASEPAVQGVSRIFLIDEPTLFVIHPNAGERWALGSQAIIEWSGTTVGTGTVDIELSRDGGATWTTLFAGTPNDGGQAYGVNGASTSRARVRIHWNGAAGQTVEAESDGNFSIAGSGGGGRRRRRR